MVGFLNSWASGVVVSVIVGSIIEMILPEGNNKKYVKTVIGIFILFTIISPVIVQFSGGIDLKSMINYDDYVNSVPASSANVVNNDDILAVYEKNISEQIKNTVERNGFKVIKIDINASSYEDNYGEIISVTLVIEKENTNVEKINIDIFGKNDDRVDLDFASKEQIRDLIYSSYGVAKDKIYIN